MRSRPTAWRSPDEPAPACDTRFVLRALALCSAFALGSLIAWAPAPPTPAEAPAPACCKTCHKGKACGDSCIARDKDCTLPKGCACDAED